MASLGSFGWAAGWSVFIVEVVQIQVPGVALLRHAILSLRLQVGFKTIKNESVKTAGQLLFLFKKVYESWVVEQKQ